MLRAARVGRDVGQVHLGALRRGEFDLGPFGGLLQALQGHAVPRQVDPLLLAELLHEEVDHPLIEVIAAQMRVPVRGLHLEGALADLQDGDVEGAAAQVVDGDKLLALLVQAVGERRRRRLVDDPQHLQPGDLARVLGRVALAVVEVGGDRDHRLADALAQIGFRVGLELLQDHGRDLGRAVGLVAQLHPGVTVVRLDQLEGEQGRGGLHDGVLEAAPHQALDAVDRVLRVGDRLALGHGPHHPLAVLAHRHHRRRRAVPLLVGDHDRLPTLHHRDDRVRRPQVNPNHPRHGALHPLPPEPGGLGYADSVSLAAASASPCPTTTRAGRRTRAPSR